MAGISLPQCRPTRYRVEEPLAYPAFSPGGAVEPAGAVRRVAVLVIHGMGQQVEFETLDLVERGLREREGLATRQGKSSFSSAVRFVQLANERLRRVEMLLTGQAGQKREVHLYEAYWAPMTEGKVTLRDVLWLLYRAMPWRSAPIERWLFGQICSFDADRRTVRYVRLAVAFVCSFLLANTAAISAIAISFLGGPASSWVSSPLTSDLTWPLAAVALFASIFVGTLLLGARVKKKGAGTWRPLLEILINGSLVLLVWMTGLAALTACILFLLHLGFGGERCLPDLLGSLVPWATFLVRGGIWFGFFLAAWQVRETLIQYVGDVAAYVSPSALDRFAGLRAEIQGRVRAIARAIYDSASQSGTEWQYDRVAVVGHSLGSVIGYDTLNRLINEDTLSRGRGCILERTLLFLTLGSPLDKTALVFARQVKRTSEAREALAATVQPLIQSYASRPFSWVNLFSPYDIVSSSLKYYDMPGQPVPPGIANEEDPDAFVPLMAHVDYWRNPKLFKILHAAVTA